jgi:hypothetical protein
MHLDPIRRYRRPGLHRRSIIAKHEPEDDSAAILAVDALEEIDVCDAAGSTREFVTRACAPGRRRPRIEALIADRATDDRGTWIPWRGPKFEGSPELCPARATATWGRTRWKAEQLRQATRVRPRAAEGPSAHGRVRNVELSRDRAPASCGSDDGAQRLGAGGRLLDHRDCKATRAFEWDTVVPVLGRILMPGPAEAPDLQSSRSATGHC